MQEGAVRRAVLAHRESAPLEHDLEGASCLAPFSRFGGSDASPRIATDDGLLPQPRAGIAARQCGSGAEPFRRFRGSALLERGLELERVEAALALGEAGVGSVLLVEGPAGIGKTRLIAAASALARSRGGVVCSARGAESEREFAFGIVRQLLGPVLAGATSEQRGSLLAGGAGRAVAALRLPTVGLGRRGGERAGVDAAAMVYGLYWVLASLAEGGPLLVCVDDAQWADAPSWRFVNYLARRVDELAVTLVIAVRTGETAGVERWHAELASDASVLALGPLSAGACAELVRDGLGGEPELAFCDACHFVTAGNPFFLSELIAELRRDRVAPTAANAGRVGGLRLAGVARSVLAQVVRLGANASELARAVAVLGAGARPHWPGCLAGLGERPAAVATDLLVGAGVLRYGATVEFVHPLIQSAVYDSIPPARRALAHAQAARLLRIEGAEAQRVAAQLLLADPAGDPASVESLCAAALEAGRRGAPDIAATYLRRALAEPALPELRGSILLALGRARTQAGDPGGLEDIGRASALDGTPRERAAVALELGRGLMLVDRSVEAIDVFARARTELGDDHGDRELYALLGAEEVGAALLDVSTARRAIVALSRAGCELAGESIGERLLLAYGAYVSAGRGVPAADIAAQAQRALAAGDLAGEKTLAAFCMVAAALCFAERYEEALGLHDAAIALAHECGLKLTFVLASWLRAGVHQRCGSLAHAEADAQNALDASVEEWFTAPVGFLVDVLIERGELDRAQAAFDSRGLTDALFPNLLVANLLLDARGRLRCAQGRYEEGLADLLAVGERLEAWETTSPAVIAWRSSAALAYAALGDLATARALSEQEVALARAFGAPRALGVALRAAGLVRGSSAGSEMLREAIAVLSGSRARLELARALTDYGAILRRRGHQAEARTPLRRGLDLASSCGATALAARAREELVIAGARPRRERASGADSLTASERRVAELAARGKTNREIAQALFVTIRTVTTHLTHIYQKLEITSRSQLPASLATLAPATVTPVPPPRRRAARA